MIKVLRVLNKLSLKNVRPRFVDFYRCKSNENVILLNGNTLIGRMMIYLNANKESNNNNKERGSKSEGFVSALKTLSTTNIGNSDKKMRVIQDKWEYQNILKRYDKQLCTKLSEYDLTDLFEILAIYMKLAPNRVTEYQIYKLALSKFAENIDQLTQNETLKFIFYIGLIKKANKKHQIDINAKFMFSRAFNKLKNTKLNIEETCIVCNAAFKMGIKLKNDKFLNHVLKTINDNLHLLNDPELFITLIKTIRHNRYQNDDLMSTITCTILFNKTFNCYSFLAICHILALYADYNYYDEALLKQLYDIGLNKLQENQQTRKSIQANFDKTQHPRERIRAKDLLRYQWSICCLDYDIGNVALDNVIVDDVIMRLNGGEYQDDKNFCLLIESLLYFWMMNHRNVKVTDLIRKVVTEENVSRVHRTESSSKQRLNVLLNLIQLESPKFYQQLNVKPLMNPKHNDQRQLAKRPTLRRVYKALNQLTNEKFNVKFKLTYEVPHLNLLGITGYLKGTYKVVFVEVLDDSVMLRNRNSPNGLMKSKLRALAKMDEALLKVQDEDISEMTETELGTYLQDELSLLI